jgi:SAM-dependent methyltransferase
MTKEADAESHAAATDEYESLARDHEWLLTDELRNGGVLLGPFGHIIDRVPRGARVLDCACGTGWNAIALRRAGFDVVATDASAAMVEIARENAAVAASTSTSAWCAGRTCRRWFTSGSTAWPASATRSFPLAVAKLARRLYAPCTRS